MIPVPVSVFGKGPLAELHRRILGRCAACRLLPEGERPGPEGVADICGPPGICAQDLGPLVRERIPLALSLPTQWPDEALARLAEAARRRRLAVVALGSLRVLPAAARLKEIVSSGVLGSLRSLRLVRRGRDERPGDELPDARLAAWRDADLCHWLAAGEPCSVECAAEDDGAPEREVIVIGERGRIEARFAPGRTPDVMVQAGPWRRQRRVPLLDAESLHLAELQLLVAARRHQRPWLLLPSLADVVAARPPE